MNNWTVGAHWILFAVIIGVFVLAMTIAMRLLPDPSIECVKAGGNWSTLSDTGHCQKAPAQ